MSNAAQDPTLEEGFLAEDDVEEVEELDQQNEEDGEMDSGDEGQEEELQEGEEEDDAMAMLDSGLDDSFSTCTLHQGAVFCLQVHPVSSQLAVSGGEDDLAFIFRTDTGDEVKKLQGHSDSVTSCGWNFDGTMVATGGMDGRVIVWKASGTSASGEWTERSWELLHTLEGPDEVNVSEPSHPLAPEPRLMLYRDLLSGSIGTLKVTCCWQEVQMELFGYGIVSFSPSFVNFTWSR